MSQKSNESVGPRKVRCSYVSNQGRKPIRCRNLVIKKEPLVLNKALLTMFGLEATFSDKHYCSSCLKKLRSEIDVQLGGLRSGGIGEGLPSPWVAELSLEEFEESSE
jgi:hypothetical protein